MKKKILFSLIICLIFFAGNAQTASVEKSTYGIQTGLLGIWIHNEMRLTNQIALRTELGMNAGIFGGDFYPQTGFLMTPVITVEPRWYYNLENRQSKSKNISGNSGNFVSLQTSYHPNWFVISNYDNLKTFNLLTIIPTWGIKRNVGEHFTYETAIGIGYGHQFREAYGDLEGVTANLHLRIGYRF
ncbi:hypothetical protein J3S90_15665 [Flavobacterium sp. P4023]|uniref:DUF3575 domain-containing protein n=1 Tax=Flavobacterium flabelliforme TaxID=2816119 RepID=A0ABS5CX81_9FLAO|nr:hypothetical protein [Flavobacterium flabelliforme]MBP4143238.1 hypothetical protein [Flavobacterium flabelliforme]